MLLDRLTIRNRGDVGGDDARRLQWRDRMLGAGVDAAAPKDWKNDEDFLR
jgi:hypothetical protein